MLRNNERCRILVFCSKYTSDLMCLLCILSCVWSPLKGRLCNQHCLSVNRIAQKVKNVKGLWIADREELFRFWGLLTENVRMATILDFCYNILNRDYRNHTARALYGDTFRKWLLPRDQLCFPMSYRLSAYITPKSPKGWPKKWLKNQIQFQSNKVCYTVSLCENFQQQSCSITIPPSNGL